MIMLILILQASYGKSNDLSDLDRLHDHSTRKDLFAAFRNRVGNTWNSQLDASQHGSSWGSSVLVVFMLLNAMEICLVYKRKP